MDSRSEEMDVASKPFSFFFFLKKISQNLSSLSFGVIFCLFVFVLSGKKPK